MSPFGQESTDSPIAAWRYFEELEIFPYTILLHARFGRTAGKRLKGLKGLKLIDKSETREIISVLSNKRKRSSHDLAAGTAAVKA